MGRYLSTQTVRRAQQRQLKMARDVCFIGCPPDVRYVGGVDMAFGRATGQPGLRSGAVGSPAVAVAVVWDRQTRRCVQAVCARGTVRFPYVPGLLSFREAPLMMAAIRRIDSPVDVWLVDGHGIAHRRGCGLATHIGVALNLPTIGVAKSLLTGRLAGPGKLRQANMALDRLVCDWQGSERFAGYAIRPRAGHEPLYISPGNRISAEQALKTVVDCLNGEDRLAVPIRLADALCAQLRLIPPHRRKLTAAALQATVAV